MDISNNRGAHRSVTEWPVNEAVRGRKRDFNIQGHGKPFTKRKDDGIAENRTAAQEGEARKQYIGFELHLDNLMCVVNKKKGRH
jgi:hypothetical protein